MTYLILFSLGLLSLLTAFGVIFYHARLLLSGQIVVEKGFNGPEQVRRAGIILLRIFLKWTVIWRRLFFQYALHVSVRCLRYADVATTYLYSKSRNFFVKNAVRNKNTVPHFWAHLKMYKQEIDREKETQARFIS